MKWSALILGAAVTQVQILASSIAESTQTVFHALDTETDPAVLNAVETHRDPVEAVLAIHPKLARSLAEPRLLRIDRDTEAEWLTEGDKLRLRKERKSFIDYTEHGVPLVLQYEDRMKAHTPDLKHQSLVRPLFSQISTMNMYFSLQQFTSLFFNRYYKSPHGVQSADYLYQNIARQIYMGPRMNVTRSRVSVRWHTHSFAQSSIIARFEPPITNSSAPLTIIAAHQDSINYDSPMFRAPGAVDDASGSISILEAIMVLLRAGYIPARGPVEFHWYAAEEGGLLGSQDVAKYYQDLGVKVGAMMQFDMTAFIPKRNESIYEHIGIVTYETDPGLTEWIVKLAKQYISIPVRAHPLYGPGASDHVSWHNLGFPAACADQADHRYTGGYRYMHTERDTMHVDYEEGKFSFDHMARFTELAIAFVVEQAGWGAYSEPHDGY